MDDLTSADLGWLEEYYLTKSEASVDAAGDIDPAHPFPQIKLNKSLNIMVAGDQWFRARDSGPPIQHLARCAMLLDSPAAHPDAA